MKISHMVALLLIMYTTTHSLGKISKEEETAQTFMVELNEKFTKLYLQKQVAAWKYATNISDYNNQNDIKVQTKVAKEYKKLWQEIKKFKWKKFQSYSLRRQFELLQNQKTEILPQKEYKIFAQAVQNMSTAYATAKLCDFNIPTKCNLTLEDVGSILESSRNPQELKHYWVGWHDAFGAKVKDTYKVYVNLSNECAKLNKFPDASAHWLAEFESDKIIDQLEGLWTQISPLYLQIHAYVRYKLRQKYGDLVSERGPIPAHLLGNMWAQKWNILDLTLPFPNVSFEDVTVEMQKQKYTPIKMFHIAEEFFTSLTLNPMPKSFWEKSVIEKPKDGREMVCHASAFDFYNNDVRIKMCTKVNEEHLLVVHHEMGHAEYFMQYGTLPVVFREASNPAFHEAIGDVIQLSISSPKHLQKIGLMKKPNEGSIEKTINSLFKIGLSKLAVLPFTFLVDKWRWEVFQGKIQEDQWNCEWWRIKQKYQGVEPPVDRSEDNFDPVAKFHVVADDMYVKYFIAGILQFQIHRSLCLIAKEYDPKDPQKPLHNCDIHGSAAAGKRFKKLLQLGRSKPWQYALKTLNGQDYMDASGLLDYFQPLQTWLENENKKNGVFIGWEPTQRNMCSNAVKGEGETQNNENATKGYLRDNKRKATKELLVLSNDTVNIVQKLQINE